MKSGGHLDLAQYRALLFVVILHATQDLVEDLNGRDDIGPLIEHDALRAPFPLCPVCGERPRLLKFRYRPVNILRIALFAGPAQPRKLDRKPHLITQWKVRSVLFELYRSELSNLELNLVSHPAEHLRSLFVQSNSGTRVSDTPVLKVECERKYWTSFLTDGDHVAETFFY